MKVMSLKLSLLIVLLIYSCSSSEETMKIEVRKLKNGLIIPPSLEKEIGDNVQGPSLIKVPNWIKKPLGKYYLYFADHKGDRIKLAYADNLYGPWKIYKGGTLTLEQSKFLTEKPDIPEKVNLEEIEKKVNRPTPHKDQIHHIPSLLDDMTIPHIASPDVHVEHENQRILMYYHGLNSFGVQVTRVATSSNGLDFIALDPIIGRPYFRAFVYKNKNYGMAMPGYFYERTGEISEYEPIKKLFDGNMRHSALLVKENQLLVFYTRVGDKPERILLSIVDLSKPISEWKESEPIEIIRPEKKWEGANLPLQHSYRSAINIPVNQIRDPAIYVERNKIYLLYVVRGENGIAIAELNII